MKNFSLQIKLLVLFSLLMLIPACAILYVFGSCREVLSGRGLLLGVKNLILQAESSRDNKELSYEEIEAMPLEAFDANYNGTNDEMNESDELDEDDEEIDEDTNNKKSVVNNENLTPEEIAAQTVNKNINPMTEEELKREKQRRLDEAEHRVIIQSRIAENLENFALDNKEGIIKLDLALKRLENYIYFFSTAIWFFLVISVFIMFFAMNQMSVPIKEVVSRLKGFQNQKLDESKIDIF